MACRRGYRNRHRIALAASLTVSRSAVREVPPGLASFAVATNARIRCRRRSFRLRSFWNLARSPFRSDIPPAYRGGRDLAVLFRTLAAEDICRRRLSPGDRQERSESAREA